MKKFINNNLSIIIFAAVIVLTFIFGGIFSRYMTNQIEVHAEAKAEREFNQSLLNLAGKGTRISLSQNDQLDLEYPKPEFPNQTYQPVLSATYKVFDDEDNQLVVIYIIETIGKYEGVKVAYAIDIASTSLIDVLVIEHDETQSYFDALTESFYAQLNNKTFDNVVFTLDSVSGSTYSSVAFETGMKYARELFARDYDFEIPNIVYTINWIQRNFDPNTFVEKPFIANITYGQENTVLEAYFDSQYNLVEVISGEMPNDTYKALFKNDFPTNTFIDVRTHIIAYDETARTVRIRTNAYGGMPITFEFTLNETFSQVTSMVITTTQTYDSDYNDGYTFGPNPAVENAFRDQYLADGTYLDSISMATVTSNAVRRILVVMDAVLDAWNKGGN